MNTMTTKKVAAAVASLVIASSAVAGTVYMLGDSDKASTQATTGVVKSVYEVGSQTVQYGEQKEGFGGYLYYDTATYEVYDRESPEAQLLLNGGDTTDYYLGSASLFTLFIQDELLVTTIPDCEGRIAAGYYNRPGNTGGGLIFPSSKNGEAPLICDNSGYSFGGVQESVKPLVASTGITSTNEDFTGRLVLVEDGLIDFDAEFEMLKEKSLELSNLKSNIIVTEGEEFITFECGNSGLNVISITEEQWESYFNEKINIILPEGAYCVINIAGEMATFAPKTIAVNGNQLEARDNTDNERVLLNFYEATDSNFVDRCLMASILAPSADINLDNAPDDGAQHYVGINHNFGAIYAKSFAATTEQGKFAFTMPADMVTNYIEQVGTIENKYVAHFYYWNPETGAYEEINDKDVYVPGGMGNQENIFEFGDGIDTLTAEDVYNASGLDAYKDADIAWVAYNDVNLDDETGYIVSGEQMKSEYPVDSVVTDIFNTYVLDKTIVHADGEFHTASYYYAQGETHKFAPVDMGGSYSANVYFVVDPNSVTKDVNVEVDVHYADNSDENKVRGPVTGTVDKIDYETVFDAIENTYGENIDGTYKNIEVYKDTVTVFENARVFDDKGFEIDYLAQISDLDYVIPEYYSEYKEADVSFKDDAKAEIFLKQNEFKSIYVVLDTSALSDRDNFEGVSGDFLVDGVTDDKDDFSVSQNGSVTEIKVPAASSDGTEYVYNLEENCLTYDRNKYIAEVHQNNDNSFTIVMTENKMDIEVELQVESNYPELFTGAFVTIMADGMANSTTELTYDGQTVSFDVPKVDYDGDDIFYSLSEGDVSVNGELFYVYSVEETTNDNGNPKFIVTVKDSYVDAYVQVIYDDGFQQYTDNFYKRPTLSADMNAMQANGNNAPETTIQQSYTDGAATTTSRVQIANDLLPGTYGLDEFDYSGLANGYYQKDLTVETLENGDILYTITLGVDNYDLRFFDQNGNLISGQESFLDQLAGTNNKYLLHGYQINGYQYPAYGYKNVWFDPVANKVYPLGSQFIYPAADTDLYLTTVRDISETPRVHFNIISFSGKHYIPGNKVAQRMAYDQTTSDFTLIGIDSLEALAADTEGKYFMVSMVLGVDNDAVASTKFTISTESLTSKTYIYEDTVSHSADNSNLVEKFCAFGIHSSGLSGTSLLGEDSFLKDYDGYRQVRMVLPAEAFENEKLYINAYYYDENGQEYLHGNYVLNMNSNDFWTLKK